MMFIDLWILYAEACWGINWWHLLILESLFYLVQQRTRKKKKKNPVQLLLALGYLNLDLLSYQMKSDWWPMQ